MKHYESWQTNSYIPFRIFNSRSNCPCFINWESTYYMYDTCGGLTVFLHLALCKDRKRIPTECEIPQNFCLIYTRQHREKPLNQKFKSPLKQCIRSINSNFPKYYIWTYDSISNLDALANSFCHTIKLTGEWCYRNWLNVSFCYCPAEVYCNELYITRQKLKSMNPR